MARQIADARRKPAAMLPARLPAERAFEADEDAAAEAATVAGVEGATAEALRTELAAVDAMLALAEPTAMRADARVRWLVQWVEQNMLDGRVWNQRGLPFCDADYRPRIEARSDRDPMAIQWSAP
jgi:hypothetical protein